MFIKLLNREFMNLSYIISQGCPVVGFSLKVQKPASQSSLDHTDKMFRNEQKKKIKTNKIAPCFKITMSAAGALTLWKWPYVTFGTLVSFLFGEADF